MTDNPHFDFLNMDDAAAKACLAKNAVALTVDEARKIQGILEREPTLSECVLWGIQGSEHCSYKSSRIHLKTLTVDGPDVVLGAKEDAGVVTVATDNAGDNYCIILSHESHNHPSQIVPFEGAATGIGGNVRDVSCMGGEVIANGDMLRFGSLDQHKTQWIKSGVVEGIASYSNALGVPNLTGDVFYHDGYSDNCLVNVVTLGVVKEKDIVHSYAPDNADDYDLILVGKPTDISGFGGASFASIDLEEEKKSQNKGAVQEPNAFLGRVMLKSNKALFDKLKAQNLLDKVGFKDLGAGGVACASVELAEAAGMGAEVDLEKVHVSMENLNPTVILCAETQERYMWVTRPDITPLVLEHYNEQFALPDVSEGAQASVVGKVKAGGQYVVRYHGETLVDAKAIDITQGIVYDRPTAEPQKSLTPVSLGKLDINATRSALLASDNIVDEKSIYETYDKQVQGRTLIERGQADAGVLTPFNNSDFPKEIHSVGVALSVACNPRHGLINAYEAGVNSVVEAMWKSIAVGAQPVAMTDCLCFGNPEKPEQMHDFVSSIKGIKDACETIHLKDHEAPTPIIAGNVSLYNESKTGSIPPSPMISCLSKILDITHVVTPQLKQAGSQLFFVGDFAETFGGSEVAAMHDQLGDSLPAIDLNKTKTRMHHMLDAIRSGLVLSAKSIGMGGIAIAAEKMSGDFKAQLDLTDPLQLFGEPLGLLVEVSADNAGEFEAKLGAVKVGEV